MTDKGSHSIHWHTHARQDLLDIAAYIAKDNLRRAESFYHQLQFKVSLLSENPNLGKKGRAPGTRELVLHPSYILIYETTTKAVNVLRVKHAAQLWPSPAEHL